MAIRLINGSDAEFVYTATPAVGEVETGTVAGDELVTLAKTVVSGELISTAYSSITVTYDEGTTTITADVSKVAEGTEHVNYIFNRGDTSDVEPLPDNESNPESPTP